VPAVAAPVINAEVVSAVAAPVFNAEVVAPVVAAPVINTEVVAPAVATVVAPAFPLPSDDDDSGSEVSIDEAGDFLHGYKVPVSRGPNLRVWYDPHYKSYRCPVCPSKKASRWVTMEYIQSHVLGQAKSMKRREENKKKWSRHRTIAYNMGWMSPPR
jgi:hypothetical protein